MFLYKGRNIYLLMLLAGLAACGKSEVVTMPTELTLRPVAEVAPAGSMDDDSTKADPELTGTTLGTDNSYVVYMSAYHPQQPEFMEGQLYSYITANSKWEASSDIETADPLYWPVGQEQMDFLAYACTPAAQSALGPDGADIIAWDASIPANGFTVTDWDTYANQYDLMYAAANGKTAGNTGIVNLTFRHTMAVIEFKAVSSVEDAFTINSLTINGLEYEGTLTVDNSRTELSASWSSLTSANKTVYNLSGDTADYAFAVPTSATQCTQHLLVPQQMAKSVTLTYTTANAVTSLNYIIRLPRTVWKAGYKYTYALNITPTEITATPSISAWDGTPVDVILEQ